MAYDWSSHSVMSPAMKLSRQLVLRAGHELDKRLLTVSVEEEYYRWCWDTRPTDKREGDIHQVKRCEAQLNDKKKGLG